MCGEVAMTFWTTLDRHLPQGGTRLFIYFVLFIAVGWVSIPAYFMFNVIVEYMACRPKAVNASEEYARLEAESRMVDEIIADVEKRL